MIDTPDVLNMGLDAASAELKFKEWEELVGGQSPGPTAFLLVVRMDVRFTPGDYQLYKRYLAMLPAHLRRNTILGLTRVDHLPGNVADEIELSKVQSLLDDCQGRYVVFSRPEAEQTADRMREDERIVESIMGWMAGMHAASSGSFSALAAAVRGVSELLLHFILKPKPALCIIGAVACIVYFSVWLFGRDSERAFGDVKKD